MKRVTISSSPGLIKGLSPLLLWITVILLPAFAARLIFNSATTMENDLYHARMQQKLRIELQKYD